MKKGNLSATVATFCRLFVALVATGLATIACAQQASPTAKPLNEQATLAAWEAFNSGNCELAITNANKCIEESLGAAIRLESKFEKEKPKLPTGPADEEMKKKIFANGLLNDVATCFFIKGRAAERLGRKDEAKKAYEEAKKFKYARTWDPDGWFWSPAEGAADRLAGLP